MTSQYPRPCEFCKEDIEEDEKGICLLCDMGTCTGCQQIHPDYSQPYRSIWTCAKCGDKYDKDPKYRLKQLRWLKKIREIDPKIYDDPDGKVVTCKVEKIGRQL